METRGKRLSFSRVSETPVRPSSSASSDTAAMEGVEDASMLSNSSSGATTASANPASREEKLSVCLRVKPSNVRKEDETIIVLDETRVRTRAPPDSQSYKSGSVGSEFTFTRVFDEKTSQTQIFDSCVASMVDTLVNQGKDGLLFAYGVTNSGKTYTVEGTQEQPGIIPRTLQRLFNSTPRPTSVSVSYLQIYNDQVHDLQDVPPAMPAPGENSPTRRQLRVHLREDEVLVEGLKETPISGVQDGMAVLARGRANKETSDNNINGQSSRSHTVWILRVNNKSKLHIVDLAGSERGKRTKATGVRQQESSNINLSLSQLMQCLEALRYNQKLARLYPDKPRNAAPFRPVPFRGSKLTQLFRDCLKGRNAGAVTMIVNASADPADYDETLQALRYGEASKNTSVEAIQASNPTLSLASLTAAMKYDYHGRLVRGTSSSSSSSATMAASSVMGPPPPPTFHGISTSSTSVAVMEDEELRTGGGEEDPRDEIIRSLRRELAEARARCVAIEMEIRDEVAREMSERLSEMESRYAARMERATGLGEERVEQLIAASAKKAAKAENGGGITYSMDDLKALAEQIDECEEEMERMREAHAREVQALRSELNAARRQQVEAAMQASAAATTSRAPTSASLDVPSALAEERKRVDRVLKDLDDERAAHRAVLVERAELQDYVERALAQQAAANERESSLLRELAALKSELDAAKGKLLAEERTVYALRAKLEVGGGGGINTTSHAAGSTTTTTTSTNAVATMFASVAAGNNKRKNEEIEQPQTRSPSENLPALPTSKKGIKSPRRGEDNNKEIHTTEVLRPNNGNSGRTLAAGRMR